MVLWGVYGFLWCILRKRKREKERERERVRERERERERENHDNFTYIENFQIHRVFIDS